MRDTVLCRYGPAALVVAAFMTACVQPRGAHRSVDESAAPAAVPAVSSADTGRPADHTGTSQALRLSLVLRAAPLEPSRGDTVRFTAVAHNATRAPISIGEFCGPGMDVVISPVDSADGGRTVSVIQEMLGPMGEFDCIGRRGPIAPGDSLVEHLWWIAPRRTGAYRAMATERTRPELTNFTSPLQLRVW